MASCFASSGQICIPLTSLFFPVGKSNYAQQKVLWNSISDSAVVSFQHILIWAHQRQHAISRNQLCLGVVKVGGVVWHFTMFGIKRKQFGHDILSSCSLVMWHSTAQRSTFVLILYKAIHHNAAPVSNYTHTASICRIFVISFVSPPNRICNLGPVCPFLLLFYVSGYVLQKGTQL